MGPLPGHPSLTLNAATPLRRFSGFAACRTSGDESESADRIAVTGWKPRERPSAPVAENRDVQTQPKARRQARPDQPLFRDHRQDRAGGGARALGPALGHGGEGTARHAEERYPPVRASSRYQCASRDTNGLALD